jgi:rhomboid family GlyGly-CTERM serine protease
VAPLCLAVVLLAVFAAGDTAALWLRYDRAGLESGQWWRLLTAHLVHYDGAHLVLNLGGMLLTWELWRRWYTPLSWCAGTFVCALTTGAGLLLFSPTVSGYMGFSGILFGLFTLGLLGAMADGDRLSRVFIVLLLAKLLTEQRYPDGTAPSVLGNFTLVADAHLWGALGGLGLHVLQQTWRCYRLTRPVQGRRASVNSMSSQLP